MAETTSSDHARRALVEELEVLRSRRQEFVEGLDSNDFPGDRADQADAIERLSELQSIERRIDEVTRLLADTADTNDSEQPSPPGEVSIGSVVTLRYPDGTTDVLRVGTMVEADDAAVVTADSPLGVALLGRSAGQDIDWSTPTGQREARVVQVSQP